MTTEKVALCDSSGPLKQLVIPSADITLEGVNKGIERLRGGHVQFCMTSIQLIGGERTLYHDDYGLVVTTPMHLDLGNAPAMEFVLEAATGQKLAPCPAAVVGHLAVHHRDFLLKHPELYVPVPAGQRPHNMVFLMKVLTYQPTPGSPIALTVKTEMYNLAKPIARTTPLLFIRCLR